MDHPQARNKFFLWECLRRSLQALPENFDPLRPCGIKKSRLCPMVLMIMKPPVNPGRIHDQIHLQIVQFMTYSDSQIEPPRACACGVFAAVTCLACYGKP